MARLNLMRAREGEARTTSVELFFDLVYVFAVTQLSTRLLHHTSVGGVLETALLLGLVWQAWIYTTWMTNWLDPERLPVRVALLGLMAASLVLSAGLPDAFSTRGEIVGGAYAVLQIGRSAFVALTIGDDVLRRNFQRLLCWCTVSGGLAIGGGLVSGTGRVSLWVAAVGVDVLGGLVGFVTPGLGRSSTRDWTLEGGHFADRCQAFLLIALGEGVVRIGESLSVSAHITAPTVAVVAAAISGSALLWWVYFDRSAREGAAMIAGSDDPGRLGRSAYHFLHPVMIAGIVVTAAADQRVIEAPAEVVDATTAWLILGGTATYLLGHALFKVTVWRRIPTTRLAALVVLALIGVVASHLRAWQLGAADDIVLLALIVSDRALPSRQSEGHGHRPALETPIGLPHP